MIHIATWHETHNGPGVTMVAKRQCGLCEDQGVGKHVVFSSFYFPGLEIYTPTVTV